MKIRTIMTPQPKTLPIDASLGDALALMVAYDIRHLPVVEGGEVVGMISDRDVKMALGPDAANQSLESIDPRMADGSVDWFMSEGLLSIDADAELAELAEVFLDTKVGALPVTDRGDLVGIVSVLDLVRAMLPLLA